MQIPTLNRQWYNTEREIVSFEGGENMAQSFKYVVRVAKKPDPTPRPLSQNIIRILETTGSYQRGTSPISKELRDKLEAVRHG
jgi:hypothetical protein